MEELYHKINEQQIQITQNNMKWWWNVLTHILEKFGNIPLWQKTCKSIGLQLGETGVENKIKTYKAEILLSV